MCSEILLGMDDTELKKAFNSKEKLNKGFEVLLSNQWNGNTTLSKLKIKTKKDKNEFT